jgi:hypothetical protein
MWQKIAMFTLPSLPPQFFLGVRQNNCHYEKKKVARKMTSLYLTTFSNKINMAETWLLKLLPMLL